MCIRVQVESPPSVHSGREEMDEMSTERLPLKLDERYNMIVCTGCCIGLPVEWVCSHLKEQHGVIAKMEEVLGLGVKKLDYLTTYDYIAKQYAGYA